MAARSVNITLINQTSVDLVLTSASLSGGIWSANLYPPGNINANSQGHWQSESDGVMTGTEGTVTYQLPDGGLLTINWDNPYAGSNSYLCMAPKGFYTSQEGDGSGNNATTSYTLQVMDTTKVPFIG